MCNIHKWLKHICLTNRWLLKEKQENYLIMLITNVVNKIAYGLNGTHKNHPAATGQYNLLSPVDFLLQKLIRKQETKSRVVWTVNQAVNFCDALTALMCWRCNAAKSPCQVSPGPPAI